MAEHGFITQEQANWAKLEVIKLNPEPQPFLAPHFVQYVATTSRRRSARTRLLHGGINVWTTLDLDLKDEANTILENNLEKYEASSNGHNGAVVIIHPPTGQILAMVGSRDYSRDGHRRQREQRDSAELSRLDAEAVHLRDRVQARLGSGLADRRHADHVHGCRPASRSRRRNPDKRTHGVIPLKQALGNSFNIPAFKTILWVGVDNMVNTRKIDGHHNARPPARARRNARRRRCEAARHGLRLQHVR